MKKSSLPVKASAPPQKGGFEEGEEEEKDADDEVEDEDDGDESGATAIEKADMAKVFYFLLYVHRG